MEQLHNLNDFVNLMPALIRLNRVLTQRIDATCDLELTPTQMNTLIVLHRLGAVSLSGLSEYMEMQKQQMTKVSDALVRKGYAQRQADPGNRRSVIITLTDRGQTAMQQIMDRQKGIMAGLLSLLDDENKAKFLTALEEIIDAISSIDVEQADKRANA